jgi:hypothetical protein
MAITFDTTNKIVQLDSTITSAAYLWSRWVDFVVLSDNAKFGEVFSQVGGVAPIDLYIFLENGWLVRPLEANGVTTITGNLLVQGGGSPVAPTLGNFNVLVNMETPVKSSAINVSESVVDLSAIQAVVDAILVDTDELQSNQNNWLTATGFSTHNVNDVVSTMQSVADDFKADTSNIGIDTSGIVSELNDQILQSIRGLGIQSPPPAYTQNYAVSADGSIITEAPNAQSITDTDNEMKNYTYKDVAGLHWPDANAGDDLYYALNLNCLNVLEGENVTSVDWIIPNEITTSDSYLNSDSTEAHVKLATLKAGVYRIWAEVNSDDTGKISKNRIRIMLKVI